LQVICQRKPFESQELTLQEIAELSAILIFQKNEWNGRYSCHGMKALISLGLQVDKKHLNWWPFLCNTFTSADRRVVMADPTLSTNLEHQAAPTPPEQARGLSSEAVFDALKMILREAPLKEVLTAVARLVEAHSSGMSCSICLLDDGLHLRYSIANLPEAYRVATDGACIGPNVGSCGAAAYLRQPVFVSDIRSHPNWARFRDIVLQTELRAAWSSPVISHDGKVLGTFCMYYREVRHPGSDDIQLIDYASRIVGIAIERDRSQTALRLAFENLKKSEAELRQIVDAIPQAVNVLDPDGNVLYANRWTLDYTGLSLEEAVAPNFQTRVFHPEDLARLKDERLSALARGVPFENEQRALGKDGKYRWFLIRYNPLLDEHGDILRWYATGTDVEDRKRAEQRIRNENLALREEIDRSSMYEAIVGSSEALRKVIAQVSKVAPTDSTVLISGETGTGKELVASAIHKRSKRSGKAFIRVNCAAIPPSLIASELFGHEKGAFTGALQRRAGRFESADGGTIFLDEIGELSPEVQVALLRVLQEREFERVGSSQPIAVDVRVLAATNRDLEAAVSGGTFRQDLFYRLNVFPIGIPPLRERKDDIPLLVEYLVERYAKKAGKRISHISKKTLDLIQKYDWPGNIRELQNVVERAVILCEEETFSVDETWLQGKGNQRSGRLVPRTGALADDKKEFTGRERTAIEAALAECHGRVSGPHGAAAKLGIPHQTLESKIASLGIDKRRFKVQPPKQASA
jgi:PAS domain S-box-containing protein